MCIRDSTSPLANTITIDVTSINDAPQGTDKTLSVLENSTLAFTADDFGFADIESDNFATLTVETLPSVGSLTLNGSPVVAGQLINAGLLSTLQYELGSSGASATDSFIFVVQDTGGTANGGVDTDQTPNTIAINLQEFNRAPFGSDSTIVLAEDTCLLYTSPSPRDATLSRMPSSA